MDYFSLDDTNTNLRVGYTAQSRTPLVNTEDLQQTVVDLNPEDRPGWWEGSYANILRENSVSSQAIGSGRADPYVVDPEYNPYVDLQERMTNGAIDGEMGQAIIDSDLLFDVYNADAMEARLAQIDEEYTLAQTAQQAHWTAGLVGGFVGAATDPISYIPFLGQSSRLGTAGRIIGNAAIQTAGSEALLRGSQDFRSWDETLFNLAGSTALTGALLMPGIAARHLSPDHPGNPKGDVMNGRAPRHAVEWDPETGTAFDGVPEGSSVGAAQVTDSPDRAVRLLGEGVLGRPGRMLNKFVMGPGARALGYTGDRTSAIMQSIYDGISTITHGKLDGSRGTRRSAEVLRAFYEGSSVRVINHEFEIATDNIRKNLASLGIKAKIDNAEFNEALRGQFYTDGMDPQARQAIVNKVGEDGLKVVESEAARLKQLIEETRKEQLDMLVQSGAISEDQIVDDFKYRQLWSRDAISQNPNAFREALINEVIQNPRQMLGFDDWLDENFQTFGITGDDFSKLQDGVEVTVTTRQETGRNPENPAQAIVEDVETKVDGGELRRKIINRWAGDEREVRLDRLETKLAEAESYDKQVRLEANDIGKIVGMAKKDGETFDLQSAQQAVKAYTLKVEAARKQGRANAERLANKLRKANERLLEIEAKQRKADDIRRFAETELEVLQKQVGASRKSVASIRKKIAKTTKRSSVAEMVDKVVSQLQDTGAAPDGVVDRLSTVLGQEAGITKERTIQLSEPARKRLEQAGYLNTNMMDVLNSEFRQGSATIAWRQAMGIGPGGRYGSDADIADAIRQEYNDLIENAKSEKARNGLRKEMNQALDDLKLGKNRLFGRTNNLSDTTNWFSRQMRNMLTFRFADGFGMAAVMEVPTYMMNNAFILSLRKVMPATIDIMRQAEQAGELKGFLAATSHANKDIVAAANRVGAEIDPEYSRGGTGVGGTRRVTGAIDRATTAGAAFATKIGGIPFVTRTMRTMAMVNKAVELPDLVKNFDSLQGPKRTQLLDLGIGQVEARRLHKFLSDPKLTKYDENGLPDINAKDWYEQPGGRAAFMDMSIALERHSQKSVLEVGMGDLPEFTDSTFFGQIYSQFLRFAWPLQNRFLYPAVQRMVHERDARAFMAMASLAFITALDTARRDLLKGNDPMERYTEDNAEATGLELLDRSGILGVYTGAVASGAILTGLGNPSRYQQQDAWQPMLGLWGAHAQTVRDLTTVINMNDEVGMDDRLKALERQVPMINSYRFGKQVLEEFGVIEE